MPTPVPATRKLPDRSLSPSFFRTGFDSPVSIDSFTSMPSDSNTMQSAQTWSPFATATTSSCTTSSIGISCSSPSRITLAFEAVITERPSTSFFTFISWMIPMMEFTIMTPMNVIFLYCPDISTKIPRKRFRICDRMGNDNLFLCLKNIVVCDIYQSLLLFLPDLRSRQPSVISFCHKTYAPLFPAAYLTL